MQTNEQKKLIQEAAFYPTWVLSSRQLCDLEFLLDGSFAPLNSFLGQEDYESVLSNMRLANNSLMPIPVVLDVSEKFIEPLSVGKQITLRTTDMVPLAILTISEIWKAEFKKEAQAVYGSCDTTHPGVDYLLHSTNPFYISGELQKISFPQYADYKELRYTPQSLKVFLKEQNWHQVVAFQTRNPMHRAHVELTQYAMQKSGAKLLLHPVVGVTKPGDIDYYTRVKCYREILKYYPEDSVKLALLPLAMRMAGPREAIWHGLIRKNYGCSHFIIGRDHAGPGVDKQGKPFYEEYEAQELFQKHEKELGIQMIAIEKIGYSPKQKKYIFQKDFSEETKFISGTKMRRMQETGEPIPEWFTYPEIAQQLRKAYPPLKQRGFTVFFTGLSGSGKSTLAQSLIVKIRERTDRGITLLDGDIVRRNLSSELGFSKEHRSINIRRIGFVASEITKNNGIVICAPIAPYAEDRLFNRKLISEVGSYIEIYVSTPLTVCEKRDVKGFYLRASKNLTKNFTGIDDPYEEPQNPDVVVNTTVDSVEKSIQSIIAKIEKLGYL